MKNIDLINQIEVYSSNALTRMISRLDIPLFDKDAAREHKYRMSVLNGLVDLKESLGYFSQNILGISGESIFKAIQYLNSSNRQVLNLSRILNTYVLDTKEKEDDKDINDKVVNRIISDFQLNKLNFDFNESIYFKVLDGLIEKYLNGNLFLKDEIISNYKLLLSKLSDNKESSLSDIFHKRIKTAGITGDVKKWFGTLFHNISLFDKTSAIRLDASKKAKEALDLVNKTIDVVEKELDTYEIFNVLSELSKEIEEIKVIIKPLNEFIKGMSYGDEFINMLEKNKLTDFPVDMSDKQKKVFENYLNRRNYKDLSNIYDID